MIDDCNINNLAKNQVSVVFHSRAICRSVSPKLRELCMESPCLCPLEGHKHGGHDVKIFADQYQVTILQAEV